jgi:predicted RNA-binding Zn ribbon-like protein
MSTYVGKPDGLDQALDTVLQFVNTRSYEPLGFYERFGDAHDFSAWASEHGLLSGEPVSESEAAAARELRSALVTVMQAHADHPGATTQQIADAELHLAHAGQLYPVQVTLSAAGASAAGHDRGVAGVLGTVLAAAQEIVQHGSWGRLKMCTCDPCENTYVDRTKSGRQRYCSPTCSSRSAMRAMRKRQQSS